MKPDFSVSYSELMEFAKSPAHYRRYVDGVKEQTPAMLLGQATHAYILDQPMDEFTFEKVDRRTTAGKERAAEIERDGLKLLSPDDLVDIQAMKETYNKITSHWPSSEKEVYFKAELNGFEIRGRRDIQCVPDFVADLKIMADASPRKVKAELTWGGMGVQAAIYTAEWNHEIPYFVVAIERGTNIGAIYRISPDTMRTGIMRLQYLMDKFAECVISGNWEQGYNFWEQEL